VSLERRIEKLEARLVVRNKMTAEQVREAVASAFSIQLSLTGPVTADLPNPEHLLDDTTNDAGWAESSTDPV